MKKIVILMLLGTLLVLSSCGKETSADEEASTSVTENDAVIDNDTIADEDLEYGIDTRTTWGDLKLWNGGELPTGKLTPIQKSMVLYPKFDREDLYYDEMDNIYHSVRWCYMLDDVTDLEYCNLQYAIDHGFQPCDKCIKPIN